MKLYNCSNCGNSLYFENNVCLGCGHTVGFDSPTLNMVTLQALPDGIGYSDVSNQALTYRFCENAVHGTCNWLIPLEKFTPFCVACELNRTIPTLTQENLERWKRIEIAKHRLVYSLLKLRLPVSPKEEGKEGGFAFDFLADVSPEERVMTGHDNGTITLNIEEADEAERTRNKLDLGEKYRTLLGHFRHEIGHYYWDERIKGTNLYQQFRNLFGDESADYGESLKRYYENGPAPNWADHFISPYASSHPWEDWAESWSHYLHMMDTLETAYYFGVGIKPVQADAADNMKAVIRRDPYTISDFAEIFALWLPLTFAVNSLNRSMGHSDFYPFIISQTVVEKLTFIHIACTLSPWKKGEND